MNVVDSSAWLEYFAGTAAARPFAPAIEDSRRLVVPVITITEVFKRILQQRDETSALRAVAVMQQGEVVPVDAALALMAARVGHQHKLPLADSLIYATALRRDATLWTQDEHFKGLPGVRYFPKEKP
ncbi:MAG: type II toxin-antitoxin system VapC family toxin [Verrucomicrobia bacterium]|nr:type II toxin-antitoxin system VapC family toxin [Verrucomicrobiota bacterium]